MRQHDVELVDAIEVLGLHDQHQLGVRARTYEREALQQVVGPEVVAGGQELLLVLCALGLRQPPPGGIELQERVLHEVTVGHMQPESIVKWGYPQGGSGAPADTMSAMRIALVSPYSWTYPGGVTRHIEALREELSSLGHDVRVLAPVDPPDRRSARRHRGAVPQERELPSWLVSLGRTMGFPANGAVSNLTMPYGPNVHALREELRTGGYDVVHLHEPVVPCVGWDTLMTCGVPMVGTFHCYSANALTNGIAVAIGARRRLNRLKVRIAVSEAAAWTGERFYGGRYRVIPNGVAVSDVLELTPAQAVSPERPLQIAFVGQAVERKGLPVLLPRLRGAARARAR